MAAAASLCLITPAAAATPKKTAAVRYYTDKNKDGICDYFVDSNKDGICDHCNWNGGLGRNRGRYFVDSNGDGICDNYQNGVCGGRGSGRGYGRRCGRF